MAVALPSLKVRFRLPRTKPYIKPNDRIPPFVTVARRGRIHTDRPREAASVLRDVGPE